MAATKQMTKSQLAAHFAEKFSLSKKAAFPVAQSGADVMILAHGISARRD